jgi:tRNA-dihydrouridine synthase
MKRGSREMRKHAAWYLKGVRGDAKVPNQINECDTRAELVGVLDQLVEEQEAKECQVNAG